jgi:hypothetical protein
MKYFKLILIFSLTFIFSCSENRDKLKKMYSKEVINYFYEIIFYGEESGRKVDQLVKWEINPKVVIIGFPSKHQIQIVKDIIQEIDNLDLPIKYYLTKDESKANIKIYFDKNNKFKSSFSTNNKTFEDVSGISSKTASAGGVIKEAAVYIVEKKNRPSITLIEKEESLLFEEILQTLGLNADSYSYPNSIFYQGISPNNYFTDIDKKMLKLLYEPSIPSGYEREEFEEDFGDILYSINTSEKIKEYIKKNKISIDILNTIEKTCFMNNTFYKHPENVNVYLSGEYGPSDSIQVLKSIESLNEIKNIKLKFCTDSKNINEHGILLKFKKNKKLGTDSYATISTYIGSGTMFLKRYKVEVEIVSSENIKSKNGKKNLIVESLYRCLGPNIEDLSDLYTERNNKLYINKKYQLLLSTIYSNEFSNSYRLENFKKLIDELR